MLWSVQPVEYCAHERLFFSHSVGREEWAAVELRTLIPFTTVGESHWVRAKCCPALLLWKGLLSRVSFQVSAERDTTERHGQLVCLCVCVPACVGQCACLYNVLLGRFVLLKPDQVCVTASAWGCIYRAACVCRVTVLIGGSKFVQDTNSCAADISGSFSITLCGVEAPDSAGVSLECPRCSLPPRKVSWGGFALWFGWTAYLPGST